MKAEVFSEVESNHYLDYCIDKAQDSLKTSIRALFSSIQESNFEVAYCLNDTLPRESSQGNPIQDTSDKEEEMNSLRLQLSDLSDQITKSKEENAILIQNAKTHEAMIKELQEIKAKWSEQSGNHSRGLSQFEKTILADKKDEDAEIIEFLDQEIKEKERELDELKERFKEAEDVALTYLEFNKKLKEEIAKLRNDVSFLQNQLENQGAQSKQKHGDEMHQLLVMSSFLRHISTGNYNGMEQCDVMNRA